MRVLRIIGLLLLLALAGCSGTPETEERLLAVTSCTDCPIGITAAACFEYGGRLYIFGGRESSGKPTNHLYCYDPQTDRWSDAGVAPMKERVRPRAVRLGEEVYMGLGFNGKVLLDSAYLQDWWCWKPGTGTWILKAEYPSARTVGPVIATDGECIYAAYGGKQNFERWIFRYEPISDEWVQMADGLARMASYPPRAHSASGAFCDGRLFLGAGYTRDGSSGFWTEASLEADSIVWHKRCPLQGKRHNAAAVSDGQYIYLAGGHFYGGTVTNGCLYNDILRYDPKHDSWSRIALLPNDGRESMCLWVVDNTLYAGLGNDKRNQVCAQLYKIEL